MRKLDEQMVQDKKFLRDTQKGLEQRKQGKFARLDDVKKKLKGLK